MKSLSLNEFVEHQTFKGCLMLFLDFDDWNQFTQYVNPDDVVENGIETDPHISIIYGLRDYPTITTDIEKVLRKHKYESFQDFYRTLKYQTFDISLFENEKYDVLKFGVNAAPLHILRSIITSNFDYVTEFPDFVPHITIAYLKPGKGKSYLKKYRSLKIDLFDSIKGSRLIYGDANYDETQILK